MSILGIKQWHCNAYLNGKLKLCKPYVCWPYDRAEATISWFLFGIKPNWEEN